VGLNNSGKSALLRMFFELRPIFEHLQRVSDWKAFQQGVGLNLRSPNGQDAPLSSVIRSSSGQSKARLRFCPRSVEANQPQSFDLDISDTLVTLSASGLDPLPPESNYAPEAKPGDLTFHTNAGLRTFGNVSQFQRFLAELCQICYLPAARYSAIGSRAGQSWFDVKIGADFVGELRKIQAQPQSKLASKFNEIEQAIADVLGFSNFRIIPIPDDNRNEVSVRVGRFTRQLDELGSGVAEFIVAAMTVFLRQPSWLLIDEPESHLYPKMQQRFLDLLSSQVRHGVLFATHSMGLARICAEKIWTVYRDQPGDHSVVAPLTDRQAPTDTLVGLQYSGFTDLGSCRVLLVEGSTDADVFRQWLPKLGLDSEILVLSLGGNDQIRPDCARQLSEFKRLGVPVSVIIDSDRDSEGAPLSEKPSVFKTTCEQLGIKCLVMSRRATENYFDEACLREVFPRHKHKALGPFEKRPAGTWSKGDNAKLARAMTKEALLATDIGKFLMEIAKDPIPARAGSEPPQEAEPTPRSRSEGAE
jgi:hypothetical protein